MLGVRARGGGAPRRVAGPRVGGPATRALSSVPRGRPRPGSLKQRRFLGNEAPRSRLRTLGRRPDRLDGSVPAAEVVRAGRAARRERAGRDDCARDGTERDGVRPGTVDHRARAGGPGAPRERDSRGRGRRGAGRGAQPALYGAPVEPGRSAEVVRPDASPRRRRKGTRSRAPGAALSGRDAHARSSGFLPRSRAEGVLRRGARDRERGDDRALPIPRGGGRRARPHLRLPGFVRRRRKGRARGRPGSPGRARPRARNRQSVPGGALEPLLEAGGNRHALGVGLGRPQGQGLSQGAPAQGSRPRRGGSRGQLLSHGVSPVGDRGRDPAARGAPGAPRGRRQARVEPRPKAKSSCRRRTSSRRMSFSARRSSTSSRRRAPAWTASSTTVGTRSS